MIMVPKTVLLPILSFVAAFAVVALALVLYFELVAAIFGFVDGTSAS